MRPRALIWIALGVGAGVAARRWLDVVEVRGNSMGPALQSGDRLLVARARPHPGAIVLAPDPRRPTRELIKRVHALGPDGVILRGDNASASTDGRTFGTIPRDEVTWRVILRTGPLRRAGLIPRGQ